jgi:signal peptidase
MPQGGRRRARSGPSTSGFWRLTLLNVGAALGVLCLVSAALCGLMKVSPIVLRSDSMAPAVSTSDLVLMKKVSAGDVSKGDIVSVNDRQGRRVTHRVVSVEPYGSSIRLTLKADANPAPDAETYDVTEVKRVVVALPWLGWLFAPADGLLALVIGGVFIGCLVIVAFVPRRRLRGTRRADS